MKNKKGSFEPFAFIFSVSSEVFPLHQEKSSLSDKNCRQ